MSKVIDTINDLNGLIEQIFGEKSAVTDSPDYTLSDYTAAISPILGSFEQCSYSNCPNQLTKDVIFRRLTIIDSLYSTNVNRMRHFGIQDITDCIWQVSENSVTKQHSDKVLVHKAQEYLNCVHSSISFTPAAAEIKRMLEGEYGYGKNPKGVYMQPHAESLISKYLHFLFRARNKKDAWGFPIYDSIVCDLIPKIEPAVGLPIAKKIKCTNSKSNIENYIRALKGIIDVLSTANPALWTKAQKYFILDYALWHIGKAGIKSYSLILTKREFEQYEGLNGYHVCTPKLLPTRVKAWQIFYSKL